MSLQESSTSSTTKLESPPSQTKIRTKVTDSLLNQTIAGSLAGLVSDAVVHPIDTIRARLMVQTQPSSLISANSSQVQYRNSFHAMKHILEHEGPKAFYKGFSAVAVGTVVGHGLYFMGYEGMKKLMGAENVGVWGISGLVADITGALAWNPMDVVKQRVQILRSERVLNPDGTKGPSGPMVSSWSVAKDLWQKEGLRGFYRGFGAGIATYAPFVMLYFALYEQSKVLMAEHYYADGRSPLQLPFYTCLVLAAITGGTSAFVTCPLDVVKTRIQTRTVHQYAHLLDGIQTIAREEGFAAFFKGAGPRVVWIGGGTAVTMGFYEYFKQAGGAIFGRTVEEI